MSTNWLEVVEQIDENNNHQLSYSGRVDLPVDMVEPEAKDGLLREAQTKEANYADLERDILSFGLRQPIQVRRVSSGKFVILNGVQRHSIHVKNGIPFIKAEYYPNVKNANDVLSFQVASNIHQVITKPVHLAKQLMRMRQLNPNITQAEMGALINKSQAYVAQILRLNVLDAEVLASVEDGTIILINAMKLAQLPHEDVEHFLDRAKKMTGEEFGAIVDQHLMRLKNERNNTKGEWEPTFKSRTNQEIKAEINRLEKICGSPNLKDTNLNDPNVRIGFLYALKWTGHMDPESVDQQIEEHNDYIAKREKQKAERKAAREAEQAAKSGVASNSTSTSLIKE